MASDSESTPSTPNIKQEDTDLQPVSRGRKKSSNTDPNKPKKRNLVRWDDDLDKQVLLTLQWACNEVGVKIPWDLVAQTIGKGISEGAIVQHLSKLRGKMVVAKMEVPPALKRGSVAKEPSKLYATSNGKKLPPPVFAAPSTPVQMKAKKQATPKSQLTPRTKSTTKPKPKRRRSEVDDSDDDEGFNDIVGDSDEEYGTAKKKARTSKPKAKETKVGNSKFATQKPKAIQVELDVADAEDINQDIMATLEDGGPASRTRHVKQDFTNLESNLTDEEEDEDEEYAEGELGDFEMPTTYSSATLKHERSSVSPRTMAPSSKIDVANWNQGVPLSMLPFGSSSGVEGNDIVPAHQQATMSGSKGLMTPLPSRNASTTSYNASLLSNPIPSNFGQNAGQGLGQGSYDQNSGDTRDLFSSVNYNGVGNHVATLNNGVTGHLSQLNNDIGLGSGIDGFDVNAPFSSTGLGDGFGYQMDDESMFDQYTY